MAFQSYAVRTWSFPLYMRPRSLLSLTLVPFVLMPGFTPSRSKMTTDCEARWMVDGSPTPLSVRTNNRYFSQTCPLGPSASGGTNLLVASIYAAPMIVSVPRPSSTPQLQPTRHTLSLVSPNDNPLMVRHPHLPLSSTHTTATHLIPYLHLPPSDIHSMYPLRMTPLTLCRSALCGS